MPRGCSWRRDDAFGFGHVVAGLIALLPRDRHIRRRATAFTFDLLFQLDDMLFGVRERKLQFFDLDARHQLRALLIGAGERFSSRPSNVREG